MYIVAIYLLYWSQIY